MRYVDNEIVCETSHDRRQSQNVDNVHACQTTNKLTERSKDARRDFGGNQNDLWTILEVGAWFKPIEFATFINDRAPSLHVRSTVDRPPRRRAVEIIKRYRATYALIACVPWHGMTFAMQVPDTRVDVFQKYVLLFTIQTRSKAAASSSLNVYVTALE
jgi:hypothetical protein